jgi:hypothetical protein
MKNSPVSPKLMLVSMLVLVGSFNAISQDQLNYMLHPLFPMSGTVILNTGDTIYGKVKQGTKLTDWYMAEIKYVNNDGEKARYKADDVMKFAAAMDLRDDFGQPTGSLIMFFESRPSPKSGKMVFMYRFEEGRINVFLNPRSSSSRIEKSSSDGKITGLSFDYSPAQGLVIGPKYETTSYIKIWHRSYYIEKDGGEFIKISSKNYEELWPSLFGDCEEIAEEIALNPKLIKWKNFLLLVRIYNEICDHQNEI